MAIVVETLPLRVGFGGQMRPVCPVGGQGCPVVRFVAVGGPSIGPRPGPLGGVVRNPDPRLCSTPTADHYPSYPSVVCDGLLTFITNRLVVVQEEPFLKTLAHRVKEGVFEGGVGFRRLKQMRPCGRELESLAH